MAGVETQLIIPAVVYCSGSRSCNMTVMKMSDTGMDG